MEYIMTRDEILDVLRQGTCSLRYKKVDGAKRVAEATLSPELIPEAKMPSNNNATYSDETIRYYDLNVEGWRSFRVENFEQVDLNES